MGIISLLFSLLALVIILITINKIKHKAINPFILFFILWSVILLFSVLHLQNLNPPSDYTYFLILIMLIFFLVGGLLGYKKKIKIKKEHSTKYLKITATLFVILSITYIFFQIKDCVLISQQLDAGVPLWQIRNWTLAPAGSDNPILNNRSFLEDFLRNIVLTPFYSLLPPLSAYLLFFSKRKNLKFGVLALFIVMLVLSSLAGGGGRLGFIYAAGSFMIAGLIKMRSSGKNISFYFHKYRKRLVVLFIALITILAGLTTWRAGNDSFAEQAYAYFALPPTLLDTWMPTIAETPPTFGLLSTFGLHSYIFRTLDVVGFSQFVPETFNTAYNSMLQAEIFRNVGNRDANAFVTPIYYFMIDGGIPFVIFASLLFGFLVAIYYRKFEAKITLKTFVMYMIILNCVFISFMRIQTVIPALFISLIFVHFIPQLSDLEKQPRKLP